MKNPQTEEQEQSEAALHLAEQSEPEWGWSGCGAGLSQPRGRRQLTESSSLCESLPLLLFLLPHRGFYYSCITDVHTQEDGLLMVGDHIESAHHSGYLL